MDAQQNGYGQQTVIPLLTDMGSPPQAEVDEASLQKAMDKNKESLKVKLMLRRPISQLVEQGILPPLKTPPAFHEQRQKLERAKMGDILKNKIQRRPDRQELIQQHILEDTTVDPSLQDKQRQLKKARLADDLNDRLSHRPGPLELIKGNILQTDETFAQAVKEGQIQFKRTCEGQTQKHPPPRFLIDEDSGSEGALSPPQDSQQSPTSLTYYELNLPSPALPLGSPPSLQVESGSVPVAPSPSQSPSSSPYSCPPSVSSTLASGSSSNGILSPPSVSVPSILSISNIATPNKEPFHLQLFLAQQQQNANLLLQQQQQQQQASVAQQQTQPCVPQQQQPPPQSQSKESSGKQRKKSKSKAQPKARTIKFHEYKGPPSAQKCQPVSPTMQSETSYELLLQQQQLFLQWQLEWQQKYPPFILPAAQKSSVDQAIPNGIQLPNGVSLSPPHQQQQAQVSIPHPPHQTTPPPQALPTISQQQQQQQQQQGLACSVDLNPSIRTLNKLEDMKVSDLKAELKKRNLPVSGSKPQLIERLKPHLELNNQSIFNSAMACITSQGLQVNVGDILLDTALATSNQTLDSVGSAGVIVPTASMIKIEPVVEIQTQPPFKTSPPPSVVPMDIDSNSNNAVDVMDVCDSSSTAANAWTNTEIVRLQQKKIEELQWQLQKSQMALQQQQHFQNSSLQQQPVGSPVGVTASSPICVSAGSLVGSPLAPSPPPSVVSAVVQQQPAQAVQPVAELSKQLHRQLLQQHLQQKMQLQQMQNQQQSVPTVNGVLSTNSGSPTSAAVKASLAAFLHNQQQAASLLEQTNSTSNDNNNNRNAGRSPVSAVLVTSPVFPVQDQQESRNERSPRSSAVLLNHQRTSSLPNFTSALTNKQAEGQPEADGNSSNSVAQPQVVITRPPPDYDEATKELHKQQFAAGVLNHLSGKGKGQKSFKSQVVDDVLEILIKNGELPPSAAQEPPTPTTPESAKANGNSVSTQPPVFPAVSSPLPATNNKNEDDTPPPSDILKVSTSSPSPPAPTLSLMEPLTPPPSMLADTETGTTTALDFDFHLDLDDIEAMDLGVLSSSETGKDSISLATPRCSDSEMNNMDVELSDWLNYMMPNGNNNANCSSANTFGSSSSSNSSSSSGYKNGLNTYGSGHDPLLSNLGHAHNPFDVFGVDDMDFKVSSDLGLLSWDYAT